MAAATAPTNDAKRAAGCERWLHLLQRVGSTLGHVGILLGSLIAFPNCLLWMIAVWLGWHTVLVARGRTGWLPLVACVAILIIKRVYWAPALVAMAVMMLADVAAMTYVAKQRSTWGRAWFRTLGCSVLWLVWVYAATQGHVASHRSRPIQSWSPGPVVCIGDSLTSFLGPNAGYPQELQQLVSVPVLNWGQPGSMTKDVLARLPKLSEIKPLAVVIELGGNDFLSGRSRAEIATNLERIISAAEEAGAEVILVEIPRGLVIDPFDGLERGLARRRDLELVPDSPIRNLILWSRVSPLGKWIGPCLSEDGLHPNSAGDCELATWVAKALERVFGEDIGRSARAGRGPE